MATQKNDNTFNEDQKKLLNIIINKGNKEKNYEILVNDIIENSENKNPKSVRSKLTTVKMKKYIHYLPKTPREEASVRLENENEESTFNLVNEMLKNE
jgi:SOS-response transcriptional repressor LexA